MYDAAVAHPIGGLVLEWYHSLQSSKVCLHVLHVSERHEQGEGVREGIPFSQVHVLQRHP